MDIRPAKPKSNNPKKRAGLFHHCKGASQRDFAVLLFACTENNVNSQGEEECSCTQIED